MSWIKKATAVMAAITVLCTSVGLAVKDTEKPMLVEKPSAVTVPSSVPIVGVPSANGTCPQAETAIPADTLREEDSVSPTTDTDKDGLEDAVEELLGTDPATDDSDGDGLTDHIETVILGSDPTAADSDQNGIDDSEEDSDSDGVNNRTELSLGTDMAQGDSDGDGIADGEELADSRTDPLVRDTDGDGVGDGYELTLGEDPVIPQDSFAVSQTYDMTDITVAVDVTLRGDQVETLAVTPTENAVLFPKTMPGYIGQAVDLTVDGTFDEARLSFSYDVTKGYVEPTVYYFSEATQTLEMLETTVVNDTVVATVTASATYVLLDRTVYEGSLTWEDVWGVDELYGTTELVLVIDDSGSLTLTDPDNKRLTVAADMVNGLPANSKVGIVRFSTAIDALTPALTAPTAAAAMLTDEYFRSDGGTAMYTAVETALSLFESSDGTTKRVMAVLSDGQSADAFRYDELVQSLIAQDVELHIIDLDQEIDTFAYSPEAFAQDVGGTYYRAADTQALAAAYAAIGKHIDLITDTDGDTIPDYYEDNMVAFNGTVIPLDKNSADTDGDGIPDNEEVSVTLVYSEDGTKVYVKGVLLSDPTLSDSDKDGITDEQDVAPLDNTFLGALTTKYSSGQVSFTMDYDWFVQDPTVYNPALSKTSSIFASLAYDESNLVVRSTQDTTTVTTYTCAELLTYFGMQNAVSYSLSEDYADIHLSEVSVGYRNVVANGQLKTVLAVIVRGTNTSIEEWSSNCDIGDLAADTEDDDWINTDNHKGFDMAANRIMRFVEQYIAEQGLHGDALTYWVTGHSRGAAIANILGANLEKAGRTAYTYAFATPNNTLAADAKAYTTIFNIINTEDFVPRLPIAAWGYSCYGRSTTATSIKDSYETQWESYTGIFDYNPSGSIDSSVETLAGIITSGADPRIDSYRYTCACHGDGSNDTVTIKNTGMSESSREKAIAKIPANALPYCIITRYDGGLISGWDFEVCQTPAYFMQLLAAFMGEAIDAYRFAVELNIADRYESAKSALVTVGVTGVEHAHYPETYYVLASNVTASDFS